MRFQSLRPTVLTVTPAKVFSCKFWKVFKTTYVLEILRTVASESVMYWVVISLSEVGLEKGEYKNYLRIALECFGKLFVLVKDDVTK